MTHWVVLTYDPGMTLRALAFAALLVACGAQAPVTAPAADASSDAFDSTPNDGACPPYAHATVAFRAPRCVYRCDTEASGLRWGDCDHDDLTGCETPLNTAENCGGCGYSCRAPAVCTLGGDCYVP